MRDRWRNVLSLIGALASLSLYPSLLLERCNVDPSSLEKWCLRGRVRLYRLRVGQVSEAGMRDTALGLPEPLLVESHVLSLLLQPSLSIGKVCRPIQLLLGGRDLCLEDHPVGL